MPNADDCDDTRDDVHPDGLEVCDDDDVDEDCSGEADDADSEVDASTQTTMYVDGDTDGYGNPAQPVLRCDLASGFAAIADDCDDTDGASYPGATDSWYDGVDSDCDGSSDYDADGDGEDSDAYSGVDCDDTDSAVNTSATEIWYDGVDQDCDGSSDYDVDGDGEDSDAHGGSDCDDTDSAVNTSATEIWYDGVDQDCDAASDYDADGDGEDSDAYSGVDCDDTDSAVNTSAAENWYDGVDQDCDAASDYDADGDGEDSDAYSGVDCDDTDSAVNTSAIEACDGIDNNCNGDTDFGICGEWTMDAWVQIDGAAAYDFASWPGVGDVDGDGSDDLIIGANGYGSGSNSIDHGAAYLFYGPITADTDTSAADWSVTGAGSEDGLGGGFSNPADLDGDGTDDFFVGAPYDGTSTGEMLLYLGSTTRRSGTITSNTTFSSGGYFGRIYGTDYQDFLGASSYPLGDIDGDGAVDLGIPFTKNDDTSGNDNHGSALLIMSGTTSLTGGAWNSISATDINGQSVDGHFGNMRGTGDVDGDGFDDLMIGATNPSWAGTDPRVYFIYGGQSLLSSGSTVDVASFTHIQYKEHATLSATGGFTVGDGGDINGDGYADLVLKDNYAYDTLGNQVGHVYIILGRSSMPATNTIENVYDLTIWGVPSASGSATRFAESLATTPDRDGDGIYEDFAMDSDTDADLVVGQNDYDDGGVFVFLSESLQTHLTAGTTSLTSETDADAILRQPASSDEARDIAFGDLDGDGSTDLIVGASGYDAGGSTGTGAIFIIPGTLQ